ncbi:hypothetical protein [Pseudomonas duriflava]|uniref:hypothetical protein n=1 Tax=Pseudomonas duriflava TaxID=459528 RepID=UPI00119DA387|nr:hypothetical protein [Pseudomonas duriflava]
MNTPSLAPSEIDVLLHQTTIQNLTHFASAISQLEVINTDLIKQWDLLHLQSGHTESAQGLDHPSAISRLDISGVDTPSMRQVNT